MRIIRDMKLHHKHKVIVRTYLMEILYSSLLKMLNSQSNSPEPSKAELYSPERYGTGDDNKGSGCASYLE